MRLEDLPHVALPDVPGFRPIAAVGAGSRGVVFRARELATGEVVALKVMPEEALPRAGEPAEAGPEERLESARCALEAAIERLAGVECSTLVRPRRAIRLSDPPRIALVMEYVEGDTLVSALARSVRFAPTRAAKIAAEVAQALRAAAAAGLVHGALHPGKVILAGPLVRLLGTGLGERLPAAFEDPEVSGRASPHIYAADEVLAGDAPTAASDAFSLGAILYHMLTGYPPYEAKSLAALRVERADGPIVWPRGAAGEIPLWMITLVDRLTSRDASARPALSEKLFAEPSGGRRRPSAARTPKVREKPPEDLAPESHEPVVDAEPVGLVERLVSAARGRLASAPVRRALAGALAAGLLLVLALALRPDRKRDEPVEAARQPVSYPPASAAAAPPVASIAQPGPEAEPPTSVEDSAREELRAMEEAIAENPSDIDALRPRLEALARREGELGVRASVLLARANARREDLADSALARLVDRAASCEAAGKFGEALAVLAEFPAERYSDTKAAQRARLECEAIRGRAARAFAEVEYRVTELLAKGEYAAARAACESAQATIGIPTWVERARELLREIGRREEEAAAAEAARRAAEVAKALHEEFERTLKECARSCSLFRYSEAERKLAELLAKPLAEKDAALGAAYAELVRREAAQFRLTAERIRSGERQGLLGFRDSPRRLVIRDVTEEGLELSGLSEGHALTTRLGWGSIPEYQAFKLMLEVGIGTETPSMTSFDERFALAVFAHHRGLEAERENELRIAEVLARSAELKAKVARAREVFGAVTPPREAPPVTGTRP